MSSGGSASRTPEQWAALQQRLALWYAMSADERRTVGEPGTLVAWCQRYGVSKKWVHNRRQDPAFEQQVQSFVEKRRRTVAAADPAPNMPVPDEVSNAELFAEVLRAQLVAATNGDPKALEFVRAANISKPFIDQLTAEFESSFPDASDEELASIFVDAFPDLCVAALRDRGWTVVEHV